MDGRNIILFLVWVATALAEEDWTKQCNRCKCMWVSGKKSADCTNISLNKIPKDLSKEIREIDFSNNPFYDLAKDEFINANLLDAHKLKLQNCSIESINEYAFNGLLLLIELDLSKNAISKLSRSIFRDNGKLRILTLSYNKIKIIEDGLFYNMTYLQRLSLDNNQIATISERSFVNLPALHHISLAHNKIQRITFDMRSSLPKLNSLSIDENPWVCDCLLKDFRQSVIDNNLITTPTTCKEPSRLSGRSWTEAISFACSPSIIDPLPSTQIEVTTLNVTLPCKVSGDPQPDVDWMVNGRILDRDPRQSKQKFITFKSRIGLYTWNNLTITNVNLRDRGDYKCIAKNPGGEAERNVTLLVYASTVGLGGTSLPGSSVPWIIGISISLIVVLIIILVLICCFCKKSTHGMGAKRRDPSESSEDYLQMDEHHPQLKKGLITEVNPLAKPPRTTVPTSINSGGTEVSEANRNLLDNESVFDCDDESRSVDYDQPLLRKSQMLMDSEYRLNNPFPPDLLLYPRPQVSPAGSSASTVADTTRLPSIHGPQSPLHSPLYDMNLYRTLPYSRSHSPFVGPPRIPRQGQGYVTIPRRPRKSWSSEPPPASELVAEPLYDNLGLRTTVDGSSALSLNKLAEAASTPRSTRMFPTSPISCDPIAEHDSPPVAASATLPRNMNSQKLTPSRNTWANSNAEAVKSPERRNSTTSLPNSDSKVTKIPPRPPPKPKKRVSAGPLFEDEGEDGTEV